MRSLWAPHPKENVAIWLKLFSCLVICLQAKNKCDPVILRVDICDQSILQYNYSKIGNNISFHLSTFAEKINEKIFHNKGKTPFCTHYRAHFAVLAQRKFFLKKSTYVQLQRSPSIPISEIQSGLAIKPKITPSLSACKNHSIILLNLSNYLWYTWFKSRMVYRIFLTMSTQ